jgi:hypothetical protein
MLGSIPLLASRTVGAPKLGKAKACILLFQVGGPYQCDTLDPKPLASEEIRGPYKPISTSVTGMKISEAFPQLSQQAKRFSIFRSVHHRIRCHNPAIYCSLVGREATDPMAVSNRTNASRTDVPHYASVISKLKGGVASMPRHVIVPDVVFNGPAKSPGLTAGYLGASHDPFVLGADPSLPNFEVEGIGLPPEMRDERFRSRQSLLNQLEQREQLVNQQGLLENHSAAYREAFQLLSSSKSKEAFDLSKEPIRIRERYGRHTMGQGALLARRLVEAGVPFVTVFSHTRVEKDSWDTHNDHDQLSKTILLPPTDQSLSALLEDLSIRGLLDETLVVWMGEFGRTPKRGVTFSNNTNNVGGRDHWCNCYSVILAGGGIQGGQVIGSSDANGGYPKERPIHISDLAATIFHALGIDPRGELKDIQGQLRFVCDGNPVMEAF